jgi:hypothetical protein
MYLPIYNRPLKDSLELFNKKNKKKKIKVNIYIKYVL